MEPVQGATGVVTSIHHGRIMGQEIATSVFTAEDFEVYNRKLRKETALLGDLFRVRSFSRDHGVGGFELEAWLVDRSLKPAPINETYLQRLGDPLVCAELALFNIELNSAPHKLEADALSRMQNDLARSIRSCAAKAEEFEASVVMIGILPTVSDTELIPENMSRMMRYRALNDQVMAQRRGSPFHIEIEGVDRLRIEHENVMLEAATTALQIQLQVDFDHSVRFYNAAMILSAPLVAASANSPFLFGKDLWDETRIPLFEQSIGGVNEWDGAQRGPKRVTLGQCYARESLFEIFEENLACYRALLPMVFDGDPPENFCHLRLHNGAIWRWNRPLIGVGEGGSYHLRIEHRVAPSGPTAVDIIANAAFFFGAVEALGRADEAPETKLAFDQARDNFYRAAKDGLRATIRWLDGRERTVRALILDELLPLARTGLGLLGLDREEIEYYTNIIERRAATGQNGAAWQRAFKNKYNCSMQTLCEAYIERQMTGQPVSEWPIGT